MPSSRKHPRRRRWPWFVLYVLGVLLLALGIAYWRLTRPIGFDKFEAQTQAKANEVLHRRAQRVAVTRIAPKPVSTIIARPPHKPAQLMTQLPPCPGAFWTDSGVMSLEVACGPRQLPPHDKLAGRATDHPSPAEREDALDFARQWVAWQWVPQAERTPAEWLLHSPLATSARGEAVEIGTQWLHAFAGPGPMPSMAAYAEEDIPAGSLAAAIVRRAVLLGDLEDARRLILGSVNLRVATHTDPRWAGPRAGPEDSYPSLLLWLGDHPEIGEDALAQAQEILIRAHRDREELEAERVAWILRQKREVEVALWDPDTRRSSPGGLLRDSRPTNTLHFALDGMAERGLTAVMRPVALRALELTTKAAIERDSPQMERGARRLRTAMTAANLVQPDLQGGGMERTLAMAWHSGLDSTKFREMATLEAESRVSPWVNAAVDYEAVLLACTRYRIRHGSLPDTARDIVPEYLSDDWWTSVSEYAMIDVLHLDAFSTPSMPGLGGSAIGRAVISYRSANSRLPVAPEELVPFLEPGADLGAVSRAFRPVPARPIIWFRVDDALAAKWQHVVEQSNPYPPQGPFARMARPPDEFYDDAFDWELMGVTGR